MRDTQSTILTTSVLDFLQVSTEFCRYLEQLEGVERKDFCAVMTNLLPMLYLKASMLQLDEEEPEGYNEPAVTEQDYDFIRHNVCRVMEDRDDFLDTFVEDFKYSETPVLCTVSECLADVYQVLRDMVEVCRQGYEDAMMVSFWEVREEFRLSWGQKLLNALRAIHDVKYGL